MILNYLKHYKKESILAPLFKMLEAIFELFVPLVIADIIDKGIGEQDRNVIIKGAGILFILALIGLTCAIKAQYYAAKAAIGASKGIRSAVFKKLMELSPAQSQELGTDTMITRLTADVMQVQNGINMTLRLFLRSPFIVIGAMIMAFTIDFRCALIFAVTIPLLALVVYGIMLLTMPMYKKNQSHLDEVLMSARENLTGVRVIRAFGMEEDETELFNRRNETLNLFQKRVGRIAGLMNPLTFIIVNAATLLILWQGGNRVYTGILTRGEVVALVNYMGQILVELIKFANLIILLSRAVACADRIKSVLDITGQEEELLLDEDPFLPGSAIWEKGVSVEFKNVSFSYHGEENGEEETLALKNISFKAEPGEIIGIIGGTGCGKTTLVNMLPGFFYPTKGEVLIDGTDTHDVPLEKLRAMTGTVLQKAVVFTGTIRENLLWGKGEATDMELEEALKRAQAWEFVKNRKGRLDARINQGGRDLSGGQRQRLSIARTLVAKPPILVFDDSSSALDYATDAALRAALGEMHEEYAPTIFMVSQRVTSLMHADKIIVLEDGCMVGIGTHEELLKSCPQYMEIYRSQEEPDEEEQVSQI